MNLEHIAISVKSIDEIADFYQSILGMDQVRNFTLNKDLAFEIFDVEETVPVYLLKKDKMFLEIFISKEKSINAYNHICISVEDRMSLCKKAKNKGYKCVTIHRNPNDLIFIHDMSGNLFEIKETSL